MRYKLKLFILFMSSVFLLNSCGLLNPIFGEKKNEPIVNEIEVSIDYIGDFHGHVFQGQYVYVPIKIDSKIAIGTIDLLLSYDKNALFFQSATKGQNLIDYQWDMFSYTSEERNNCTSDCPPNLVRIKAEAETHTKKKHPIESKNAEIAVLKFLVTNDRTYECERLPIRFYWQDCNDNILIPWEKSLENEKLISNKIFNYERIIYDCIGNTKFYRNKEIQNKDTTYPTYSGAQEADCGNKSGKDIRRVINFRNGGVQLECFGTFESRGDINLNNVACEFADAFLFRDYFIYGDSVFTVNLDGQIEMTDINADCETLTVADFVYLIRVLIGDALPYPKLIKDTAYYSRYDTVSYSTTNKIHTVNKEVGAVSLILPGEQSFELLADSMDIVSNYDGVNTRIFIYSIEGKSISGGFLLSESDAVSIEFGSTKGATVILTK